MILMRANPQQKPLEGLGPKETFLGPEMATSKASATWAQKSRSGTKCIYFVPLNPPPPHPIGTKGICTKQFLNQQLYVKYKGYPSGL